MPNGRPATGLYRYPLRRLAFALHMLIELPASFVFVVSPERQLDSTSDAATLVLQQYGALLLATIAIAAWFALKPRSGGAVVSSLALGLFHLAPARRAAVRLHLLPMGLAGSRMYVPNAWAREEVASQTLGGPWVHLVAHLGCSLAFFVAGVA